MQGILLGVNAFSVILSLVLGFVTIYLSAFISAKRASKVRPIELLRNSGDIKIKQKKLKVPKVIQKLFGTGGVLAYKNLKRSKRKYRTTVISIAVSVCVFITINAFIGNAFDISQNYYEDYEYNIKVYCNKEYIEKIASLEDIEEYYVLYEEKNYNYFRIYDKEKIEKNYYEPEDDYKSMQILGLDDETFRKYAEKVGVNYEKVKDAGILVDNYVTYHETDGKTEKRDERIYKYKIGDTIVGKIGDTTIEKVNGETKEVFKNDKEIKIKVGAISDIRPYGMEKTYYQSGIIVVNIDRFKDIEYDVKMFSIESSNASRLEQNIYNLNADIGVINFEEQAKQEKAMVLVIQIFLYGFIGVITLIGVTNIFNTITSNMELRQKEFAMLKSIGMTKKEFNRMINLETIFYGTKSLLYGIALGMVGTYFLYMSFKSQNGGKFFVPSGAIILSVVSVFILIFVIMKYSVRKINKQNTIETIRKDNI